MLGRYVKVTCGGGGVARALRQVTFHYNPSWLSRLHELVPAGGLWAPWALQQGSRLFGWHPKPSLSSASQSVSQSVQRDFAGSASCRRTVTPYANAELASSVAGGKPGTVSQSVSKVKPRPLFSPFFSPLSYTLILFFFPLLFSFFSLHLSSLFHSTPLLSPSHLLSCQMLLLE